MEYILLKLTVKAMCNKDVDIRMHQSTGVH